VNAASRTPAVAYWWRPDAAAGERGVIVTIAISVVAAWSALIALLASGAMDHAHRAGATDAMPAMAGMPGMAMTPGAGGGHDAGAMTPAMWSLMVVAMMLPAIVPAVRHVAANSLRWRRRRAMVGFLAVYGAGWLAFGAVVIGASRLWSPGDEAIVLAPALGLAAGWQLTASKRRALLDCHRSLPLPPRGTPATTGLVRFAAFNTFACVRSCWAMMLAMALASSTAIFWMVAITGIVTTEKLARRPRHATRAAAVLLAPRALVTAHGAAG
jgi:predicted metal-binding membrane protein